MKTKQQKSHSANENARPTCHQVHNFSNSPEGSGKAAPTVEKNEATAYGLINRAGGGAFPPLSRQAVRRSTPSSAAMISHPANNFSSGSQPCSSFSLRNHCQKLVAAVGSRSRETSAQSIIPVT